MATKRKATLKDLAIRQQVLLERFKTSEARNLVASIAEIEKAIVGVVGALYDDIGVLTKKELLRVLSELNEKNSEITEKAVEKLKARFGEFADYQADFEGKAIEVVAPSLRLERIKKGVAYANALAQPLSATGQLLETFVDGWGYSETTKINNAVRKAWAEGWTNQELIQSIRGTKRNNFKDGILQTTRNNADAIARTAVQHVANASRAALWEKNKDVIEGYEWVSTLDSKTTQQCQALDGKVFKLNQGPIPPIHIRCRSTTVAKINKELGLDFLDEGATRASVNGSVDAKLNYYEWLKQQPEGFQVEALGKTRAKLFRDGGLSADEFAKLSLGRNFQPMTLEEMRNAAPSVFDKAGIDP